MLIIPVERGKLWFSYKHVNMA